MKKRSKIVIVLIMAPFLFLGIMGTINWAETTFYSSGTGLRAKFERSSNMTSENRVFCYAIHIKSTSSIDRYALAKDFETAMKMYALNLPHTSRGSTTAYFYIDGQEIPDLKTTKDFSEASRLALEAHPVYFVTVQPDRKLLVAPNP